MSSDFSITEFRRRRASDNPPPPETGQLPLEMPAAQEPGAPQEYVPQAAPAHMTSPIPEAVPHNNSVPQPPAPQSSASMGQYAQPVMAPVPVQPPVQTQGAVQPPMQTQGAIPLPMPLPVPQVDLPAPGQSKAQSKAKSDKPKKESKSLIAGVLAKFKKDKEPQTSEPTGPVEYKADAPAIQNASPVAAPQAPSAFTAPLKDSISAKSSAIDKVLPLKEKAGLPTWAAFALGLMSGVILTFAGLALTAKKVDNSLEARFSEMSETIQSAGVEPVVGTITEGGTPDTAERPQPSESSRPPI